jgi:hypothetical protein
MQMRKWIIVAIVASALFAVGAFAASFSLTAENVSSGAQAITSCGANASVHWHIDDTHAVVSTSAPGFLISAYDISAPGCGTAFYRLAISLNNGANQVLCPGQLGQAPSTADNATNIALTTCTPSGSVNVSTVTGAALLLGDKAPIALQVTP